jgi:hypothetical protein
MSIIFRWSIWGDKRPVLELLSYSINTFKHAFRNTARYVVCTDEPAALALAIDTGVDVLPYDSVPRPLFSIDSRATWKKWCPTPRLDSTSIEFYVDSDVFLVGEPVELRRFISAPSGPPYLALREAPGSPHKVGRFSSRILEGIPPINTGFLGQRAGFNITKELLDEFRWWEENIPKEQRESHDDQGAVVAILSRYYLIGLLELLPQERYMVVSPTSNRHVQQLKGVAAIHTTHSNHPGFERFRRQINEYLQEP